MVRKGELDGTCCSDLQKPITEPSLAILRELTFEGLLNTLLEYNMIAFNGFKCPRSCFLVEEGGISDQEPSNHQ